MLRIWDLKSKADQEKAEGKTGKKVSGAQIRVQRDVTDLTLPPTMTVKFPEEGNLMHFRVTLKPDEGVYKDGEFTFDFKISPNYPIDPPKVRCEEKIYHPNIDLDGNVCLNILREDWTPVLSLNSVVVGIQFLFLEPNQRDPLNKDAANSLQASQEGFAKEVRLAMQGHSINGESFDRVL